jgi:hypothetical protein
MFLPFKSKGTFMLRGVETYPVPRIESWLTVEKFVSKNNLEEGRGSNHVPLNTTTQNKQCNKMIIIVQLLCPLAYCP